MSPERDPGSDPAASGAETPGAPGTGTGRPADASTPSGGQTTPNMLPGRRRRSLGVERLLARLVATGGIIGIGVALGAILASSNVQGWITGGVVAVVTVILSAVLWSSREL